MIHAVIIDDEFSFRQGFKKLLSVYCPSIAVIGEADGLEAGLELLERVQAQLAFLDVQMQDGTGIELARRMDRDDIEIIFTTAYEAFALEAIKLSALDYLLKPVDPDDLVRASQKAIDRIEQKIQLLSRGQVDALVENAGDSSTAKKLVLKDSERVFVIPILDIVHCEATGGYTHFYLKDKRKILISNNLREYENKLKAHGFYRCHHSHLFNIHELDHYEKGQGGYLVMKDGSRIPVSVRKKEQVLHLLSSL